VTFIRNSSRLSPSEKFGIFKRFLEIIAHFLTHASKTFIFVLSVHKLTIHCQVKTAEEITQIAKMNSSRLSPSEKQFTWGKARGVPDEVTLADFDYPVKTLRIYYQHICAYTFIFLMKQVPVVHCLSFILYFFFSHWIACTSIYCFGICLT
jgi:hypothetical protein